MSTQGVGNCWDSLHPNSFGPDDVSEVEDGGRETLEFPGPRSDHTVCVRAGSFSVATSGNSKEKVVPAPSSLSTQIVPPCDSTMERAMRGLPR